jgi:hypothetical protein
MVSLVKKADCLQINIMRFLSYYTDINSEWLLTGKNEMFKTKPEGTSIYKNVGGAKPSPPPTESETNAIYSMLISEMKVWHVKIHSLASMVSE